MHDTVKREFDWTPKAATLPSMRAGLLYAFRRFGGDYCNRMPLQTGGGGIGKRKAETRQHGKLSFLRSKIVRVWQQSAVCCEDDSRVETAKRPLVQFTPRAFCDIRLVWCSHPKHRKGLMTTSKGSRKRSQSPIVIALLRAGAVSPGNYQFGGVDKPLLRGLRSK